MDRWNLVGCVAVGLLLSGCAVAKNVPQLLTLRELSKDRDVQHKIIEGYEAQFEALVRSLEDNSIAQYKDTSQVRRAFGDPLRVRDDRSSGEALIQWVYRDPTQSMGGAKVYLTFDGAGNLVGWKFKAATKKSPETNGPNQESPS